MTIRYSPDSVAAIADAETRRLLIEDGIPESHFLFTADPVARVVTSHSGIRAVRIGTISGGDLCVDSVTGRVFVMGRYGGKERTVNFTIKKFVESVAVFDRMYPFYGFDAEYEDRLAASIAFKEAIEAVDPSAVAERTSHWYYLVLDIENGDYGVEKNA